MALPSGFLGDIGDVPVITDGPQLWRRSRDNYWYSPVLRRLFDSLVADVVVIPRDEADVVAVLRACHRHRVPVTPRGAGTANYGQCVPLHGGAVLDLSSLDRVLWIRGGAFRAQAGIRMGALDATLRQHGEELRMHPSTRDQATLGGFVAGGSGGIGSVTWGMLRERGNLIGARVVTAEAEPRVLELRGDDVARIAHAYGTTGIVTELELPTAPAHDWIDTVVTFDGFDQAARFGQLLAEQAAIIKKLSSVFAPPIPVAYLRPLRGLVEQAESVVVSMIAPVSWEAFERLVAAAGGRIVMRRDGEARVAEGGSPVYQLTWNHTTMWALRADSALTYLQTAFPPGKAVETAQQLMRTFGDEIHMHLEFLRSGAGWNCAGIELVRYTTDQRLAEIMAMHEAMGCRQFNPHTFTVEEGGMKQIDAMQVAFKREIDPLGLLNPGKLLGWSEPDWDGRSRPLLPTRLPA